MTETREIKRHASHDGHGPHLHLPAGFTPMRLLVEALRVELVITCPVATLGRHSEADIRIALADVSRRHCEFVYDHGAWQVHDLHSLNGLYVNHERMTDATLFAGDLIRIGNVTMLVLAATPTNGRETEKLRQIADVLPKRMG